MSLAKDAIGNCQCKTCPYFHQVQKGPVGVCIKEPPKPFIIGMVPGGGPLVDPSKPQQMQPIIHGYFSPVSENDGCGAHPDRAENRPTMIWQKPN